MQYLTLWRGPQKNEINMLLLSWGLETGSLLKGVSHLKCCRKTRTDAADGRDKDKKPQRSVHARVNIPYNIRKFQPIIFCGTP